MAFLFCSTSGECLETLTIKIKNWEKYNPRVDRKKHSWFRLENDIATDPKFFGLTIGQKFITICIFAEASKSANGGGAAIFVEWLADHLKIKSIEIIKTIQSLESLGILTVTSGNQLVSTGITTNDTLRDDTLRDDTLRTNERNAPSNELPVADTSLPPELSAAHGFLAERKAKAPLVREWLLIFPEPDWIVGELKKAHVWECANPRKKKKDFGKFMTNWLTRGWDSRKIQSKSFNKAEQRTENNRAAGEAYMQKLEREKV